MHVHPPLPPLANTQIVALRVLVMTDIYVAARGITGSAKVHCIRRAGRSPLGKTCLVNP